MAKIIVTGGCGFIGSNFLNLFVKRFPEHTFLNIDCMTYAANLDNVKVAAEPNYIFSKTDITDGPMIEKIFEIFQPDWIVNFAAESHVARSICCPDQCVSTNILGTKVLLDACKFFWKDMSNKVFLHIGTDEVYGETIPGEKFTEDTPYRPNTPYAASKASANHLVRIYGTTYKLPTRITCCSNNYGPHQHVEKFFPLFVNKIINKETLTIHGDGLQTRDWIFVDDHCEAIWKVLENGRNDEVYNIGGDNETTIVNSTRLIIKYAAHLLKKPEQELLKTVTYIPDRPANDKHYAIDSTKIQTELGWSPVVSLKKGFKKTVEHYINLYSK